MGREYCIYRSWFLALFIFPISSVEFFHHNPPFIIIPTISSPPPPPPLKKKKKNKSEIGNDRTNLFSNSSEYFRYECTRFDFFLLCRSMYVLFIARLKEKIVA